MRAVHCDFCYAVVRERAWDCPCDSFEYGAPRTSFEPDAEVIDGSIGDWLACDGCARLIKAGDRDKLARRALHGAMIRVGLPTVPQSVLDDLRCLHDQFWSHRNGEPVEIGAEQLALIASDPAYIREPR